MDCEKLLQSGYKSVSMGVSSIDFVVAKALNEKLRSELENELAECKRFMDLLTQALNKKGESPKDISSFSKMSANAMATMKLIGGDADEKIIEMMIKGTQMGIDELNDAVANADPSCTEEVKLLKQILHFYQKNMSSLKAMMRN